MGSTIIFSNLDSAYRERYSTIMNLPDIEHWKSYLFKLLLGVLGFCFILMLLDLSLTSYFFTDILMFIGIICVGCIVLIKWSISKELTALYDLFQETEESLRLLDTHVLDSFQVKYRTASSETRSEITKQRVTYLLKSEQAKKLLQQYG